MALCEDNFAFYLRDRLQKFFRGAVRSPAWSIAFVGVNPVEDRSEELVDILEDELDEIN